AIARLADDPTSSPPHDPARDPEQADQHAQDDPPRLPGRRGVLSRQVVAAVRTAFGVRVDRPPAIRAGRRVVVLVVAIPIVAVEGPQSLEVGVVIIVVVAPAHALLLRSAGPEKV